MKPATFILVISLALCFSCSKKKVDTSQFYDDLNYYPLNKGRFIIFEADSIVYTEIPRDTIHYRYRIKELLGDTFTDDEGKTAWKLIRLIKKYNPAITYDSLPWLFKDLWQINADHLKVSVVEENQRFTKLIFPVKEGAQWDGNAANSGEETLYTYSYVNKIETVGGYHFEKVLQVTQKDFRTLISVDHQAEKYAHGVGLVYKEHIELYSNNIVPQKAVENRIEKGVVFTQTLIAHGYE